jgi:hypothetical protein
LRKPADFTFRPLVPTSVQRRPPTRPA